MGTSSCLTIPLTIKVLKLDILNGVVRHLDKIGFCGEVALLYERFLLIEEALLAVVGRGEARASRSGGLYPSTTDDQVID